LDHKNNFAGILSNAAKYFDILPINVVVLPNYFDELEIFFSDLYLVKLLDSSMQNCSFSAHFLIRFNEICIRKYATGTYLRAHQTALQMSLKNK